jgi:hypothetical protein
MARAPKPIPEVFCPYCGAEAELVPDTKVYARSYGGKLWMCAPCKAWVGCHKNSSNYVPLGRLATAELRRLKMEAHALFDPLWKAAMKHRSWSQNHARNTAYGWLAKKMGIPKAECHIGMFDEDQARAAIAILRDRQPIAEEVSDACLP